MNTLIQDARYSLRLMAKRPGTTLLVITTLVLGIGLNAAIFSVVNAVILRPLPVRDPDRIVSLYAKVNQAGANLGISYPEFLDWKAQTHSFQEIAARYALTFTMTGNGSPEHLKAFAISASGFRTWGVTTIIGRDFTDDDDQRNSNRVAILSHAFWLRKFGGDSSVLGKALVLDQREYTIIGVLQPTQIGALKYPDVWVPNGPFIDDQMMRRNNRYFFPIARLKPDVTPAQAQAELETIAARLAAQYPATNKGMGVTCVSETELFTADGRKPLPLLILASSLIFLLAAVNVMTVFMGNTVERGQELSVRLAIGATRSSLLRQLFIQALIFALIGGILGLLFAKLALAYFVYRFPNALVRFQETDIDFRVTLVTGAMAFVASLTAIVLPALYALRLNPAAELKGEWTSFAQPKYRTLARAGLILFEISLASGLALVSGLLIKSFYEVEKVDLGFNPSHVFAFQISPPATRYKEPSRQAALYKVAVEKLTGLPGFESTSATSGLPLTNQADANDLEVDDQSPMFGQHLVVEDESVLPHFFQTMNVPLLQGRDFSDSDRDSAPPVVILDDVLAAKLWPSENPLGKRVHITNVKSDIPVWREVIGVVRQIKHFGPERRVRWMQLYFPLYQNPTPTLSFVINTRLPEAAVKASAEQAIHQLDKELPVESFEKMDFYLDTLLSGRKLTLLLLSAFAAIGIVLGLIGIYGAVVNSILQRRREIAIRMALGATPSQILMLVTRLALSVTLAGIVVGSVLVASMTRILNSVLFGISTLDPTIYAVSAIMLILLAILASIIPTAGLFRFNIQEILR